MEMNDKIYYGVVELFMQYGIKSVSMDDIASKLGISKKTIYNYIENKNDLVNKIISRYTREDEEIFQSMAQTSENAIDEMINISRHVLKFLRSMKPSLIYDLKKYYRESWNLIEMEHFSFIKETIKENIERGIKEGLYRKNINAEIIARFYSQLAQGVSDENIFPLNEFTRVELFEENVCYHMHGIVNDAGRIKIKNMELKCFQ